MGQGEQGQVIFKAQVAKYYVLHIQWFFICCGLKFPEGHLKIVNRGQTKLKIYDFPQWKKEEIIKVY